MISLPLANAPESRTPAKSHKRQASIGLGIVTHLTEPAVIAPRRESISKNDSFFDTAASLSNTMKPPPSLSISTKLKNHCYHHHHHQQQHHLETAGARPTFADRIRSIVLANRKTAAITPENIVPLPSPAQPSLTRTNTFTRHAVITPTLIQQPDVDTAMEEDESHTPPPSSAIPIISLSPSFSPNKTNVIPPLQEVPMLGDMEDDPEYYCNNGNIVREFKFPSPAPTPYDDVDNLLGKHIWKFRIKELLGVGAFSKVFLAHNMEEGGLFAVKMINKERMYQDLRVKSSGELFDFVQHMHNDIHQVGIQSNIDELLIKRLALELIQVVLWLHEHNIVHRDLKLENILVYFDEQTGDPHIKVTDFGLARIVNPQEPKLTTRCGSEEYAAPEIVQSLGYDGRLTDTWSIGIIVFALLVGYLPFTYDVSKGEKISHLFHRIVMAQVKWPQNDNISLEAKEVVEQILVRNPDKRARLQQVVLLPWFTT
ncbi:kinase-like domain-containing protein [Mucor lusitanicus]|uniref:Kinase-like domain-containing protein n=1 Tax=Mucor circinelloides f. lusitanicus TaxID=29924 RepID=A0A8H4BMY6_MUCCL|nr:kinase-like domain-containing protein [Mucor lusitanicus]